MKRKHATAAAALVLTMLGAGCSSTGNDEKPKPDVAACKAAMKRDYEKAQDDPSAPSATRPPACAGVDDTTLQRLAAEIMSEVTPTPTG